MTTAQSRTRDELQSYVESLESTLTLIHEENDKLRKENGELRTLNDTMDIQLKQLRVKLLTHVIEQLKQI